MQNADFLPLFKPSGENQTLGPFIANQRLFHLEAPFHLVKDCLAPAKFHLARQLSDVSSEERIQTGMPQGCHWHPLDNVSDREARLSEPPTNRVCILIEAGIGKTIAMQQIQYLRSQRYPSELTVGIRFADLPTDEDEISVELARTICRNPELKNQKNEVQRLVNRSLKKGTLTLIIDSLDERESIQDAAEKSKALGIFLNQHPNLTCYVSGRPYSIVDEHWTNLFNQDGWSYIQIDEFNKEQQIVYVGAAEHKALERLGASEIAQPRLLESVRQLDLDDLRQIRTEAQVYARVMQRTLKKAFEKPQDINLDQEEVIFLLSLIAYEMVVQGNFAGIQPDKFSKFVHDCFLRCSQTEHAFRYANWEVVQDKIKELGKLNEFIKFALLAKTGRTQIVFRSRTLQAFFAALWVGRLSNRPEEVDELRTFLFVRSDLNQLETKLRHTGSENDKQSVDEIRNLVASEQGRYEFWKMLCELGSENPEDFTCRDDAAWVQAMESLFLPAAGQVFPVRSTEMIYRSFWGLMEVAGCLPSESQFYKTDQSGKVSEEKFDYLVEHDFQDAVTALQQNVRSTYEQELGQNGSKLASSDPSNDRYQPVPLSNAALGRVKQSVQIQTRPEESFESKLNADPPQRATRLLVTYLTNFLDIFHQRIEMPESDQAAKAVQRFDCGFVKVDKGKFQMGDARGVTWEPEHEDEIEFSFLLHQFPMTNEIYDLFDASHQGRFKEYSKYSDEPACPTVFINWYDAWCGATWCLGRMPNEQQWERACRGPVNVKQARTLYWSGDKPEDLACVAWYYKNSGEHTHPVIGTADDKPANSFGLYHMHGQVWEWQHSWYIADPKEGKLAGFKSLSRVLRGGSFNFNAGNCRSSSRLNVRPRNSSRIIGFRVSRA